MHVLLVDDEKEFVNTLAERLSFRGFKVDYAIRALDALALAEKNVYDLAVLDMKMPGTNGLELKGLLEKIQKDMKFIFLTGHGSEADYVAGSSESACYLVKPVKIDALIAKMLEAVKP
ncbi:MAG: response regulator [Proteobacteria bacterium]|nr:response regulator [Pseudomonadota bacterium]